ncbi:MAG: HAD family hydrolase [Bdellovibrionaceae bacterium]|nr:HAD family hydrolase [Pseudobdellovibrionaceae bacterium]
MSPISLSEVEGIIFDLDDTLIDSSSGYVAALREVGIAPDSSDYLLSKKIVKSRLGNSHPNSHNRLLYFKEWLTIQNSFTPRRLLEIMEAYESKLTDYIAEQWDSLGRDELFSILVERRIAMVVLTNENLRTQLLKMRAIDPEGKYFRAIVTSEEVGYEKPHFSMFEAALKTMVGTKLKCLMIGDDEHTDLAPAEKLGLTPILTVEFNKMTTLQTTAYPVVDKLTQILEF